MAPPSTESEFETLKLIPDEEKALGQGEDALLERPVQESARPPWQSRRIFYMSSGLVFIIIAALCLSLSYRPQSESGRSVLELDKRTLADACMGQEVYDPTAVIVVTFNLYWWCMSDEYGNCKQNKDGKGYHEMHETIRRNHPFDLVGFQECDDVGDVMRHANYPWCFETYNPGLDIPIAWNNLKYGWISNGYVYIGHDKYGDRHMTWVRLAVRATRGTIFFANTHGPVEQCMGEQGVAIAEAYLKGIAANMEPYDTVLFAGDFNCGQDTDTIRTLSSKLALQASDGSYGGADHIFSNYLPVLWEGTGPGGPSDHQLLKVTLRLPGTEVEKFTPGPGSL